MKRSRPFPLIHIQVCALLVTLIAPVAAISATGATNRPAVSNSNEARTERYFQSIRNNPNLLLAFLREMPKGGDLHNHLTGSVYAESYMQWASEQGDCVCPKTLSFSAPPCNAPAVPVANAFADTELYATIIDAISMRNWQYSGQSGHDHFFAVFGKYAQATNGTTDKALAETAARAASQHEVYQELMLTPTGKDLETLAQSIAWDDDFSRLQQKLLDGGLPRILATASQQLSAAEASRDKLLQCGTPTADPGCQVVQRYIAQVSRGKSKQIVFAEILYRLSSGRSRSETGRSQPALSGPEPGDGRGLVCPHARLSRCTCACSITFTNAIRMFTSRCTRANWSRVWFLRRTCSFMCAIRSRPGTPSASGMALT